MDIISSRHNELIRHMKKLGEDRKYRYENAEFLCDGEKLLIEALKSGAKIKAVLTSDERIFKEAGAAAPTYLTTREMIDYVSPLKTPQEVLFTCAIPMERRRTGNRILILENLQDPGNLGTIIRTADAFCISDIILLGSCTDLYNPKTIRGTMGALFRVNIIAADYDYLSVLQNEGIRICAAALRDDCVDIRNFDPVNAAVVIGNEGNGVTERLLSLCDETVKIPMNVNTESLNAAVAASVFMWEMFRKGDSC